jgi:CRISPR-associated protein Csm2
MTMPVPDDLSRGRPRGSQGTRQRQSGDHPPENLFASIKFSKPLDPELFNGIAKDAATKVAFASRDRNKSTQLRRFYDELCLWDLRVQQQPEKFSDYLPFIRMLNAKVAYAEGRKLVDGTYASLLHHTLREIKDSESLATCKLFWEAFTGFYKQERTD